MTVQKVIGFYMFILICGIFLRWWLHRSYSFSYSCYFLGEKTMNPVLLPGDDVSKFYVKMVNMKPKHCRSSQDSHSTTSNSSSQFYSNLNQKMTFLWPLYWWIHISSRYWKQSWIGCPIRNGLGLTLGSHCSRESTSERWRSGAQKSLAPQPNRVMMAAQTIRR